MPRELRRRPSIICLAMLERLLRPYIKKRLDGYVTLVNAVDPSKPKDFHGSHKVAVIGAGLAGLGAAALLGERGFQVTLFEKSSYLGGKTGCWPVRFSDGSIANVDHGFHAFFRHYYNLRAFLDKIGASGHLKKIDDYLVLTGNNKRFSFKHVSTTPVLNILSLGKNKFYRFRDVLLSPSSRRMGDFLKYDANKTFEKFDDISFDEFATGAKLPASLRLVFNTFARAFFAPAHKLSTAELIKSFHFFYLSHDHGLLYDYFDTDYSQALIEPLRRHLARYQVTVKLDQPIVETARENDQFLVGGEGFDALILAADVVGARQIAANSSWMKSASSLSYAALTALEPSDGYAIYRIWLERKTGTALPVFVITEKRDVLDSVTFYHQFDHAAAQWAEQTGGGVYELHCYALPPGMEDEEKLKSAFLAELHHYFPELKGARMLRDHLQAKRDFSAFHTGLHRSRPGYKTEIADFYLAGDWVKLPTPAMLMEAAFTSGLLCANSILAKHGLQEEPVYSVPLRGILA
jgi:carotenoid phi-ring synthase / carotenoid chi-ring synthase